MAFSFLLVGPAAAGSVTCEQGQEALCDEYCTHSQGGMSTNPDGSVTCSFSVAMRDDSPFDQTILDENDWIVTLKEKPVEEEEE